MKRVLIVDDNKLERTVLTQYLKNLGYQVESASSGSEALTACAQNSPDVVVSDMMMPQMDGLEFCRRLRATPFGKLVPFIFLSGKNAAQDQLNALEIGADDYLIKPVNPRELVTKIEALLERTSRMHQE